MTGFERLLNALAENQAKFIIVGAYAAIAHGSTQRTDDLDICYERTPDNYKNIMKAIGPFHPRPRDLPGDLKVPFDEHSLAQGTNFTLVTDHGKLDLLGEMSGVGGYKEALVDAEVINLGGIICRVASLDTVIRSKEAADRPKDRARLPELKALQMMNKLKRPERDGHDR